MTLADPATQRFLATKEVVVLATLQADGAPLAMPMWFLHDPSAITMISVDDLQKVKNLRRDPRVCVVAEAADANGIRGVTIQGRAGHTARSSCIPRTRIITGSAASLRSSTGRMIASGTGCPAARTTRASASP